MRDDKPGTLAFDYVVRDSGPLSAPARRAAEGELPVPAVEPAKAKKASATVDEFKAEIASNGELLTALRSRRDGIRIESQMAKQRISALEAVRGRLLADDDFEALATNTTQLEAAQRQMKDCDLQLAELHLRMRPLAEAMFNATCGIDLAAEKASHQAIEPKLHEVKTAYAEWQRLSAEYIQLNGVTEDLAQRNQHRKQYLAQVRESEIIRLIG